MIIVDTTIWAALFGRGDATLSALLNQGQALLHPYVRGELALGNLPRRAIVLADLDALPKPPVADDREVATLIESAELYGSGIGYVDAHLIASTMLTPRGCLWTLDKRLHAVATRLKIVVSD